MKELNISFAKRPAECIIRGAFNFSEPDALKKWGKKNPLSFDRGFSLLNKNTHILLHLAVNYEAINIFKKVCQLVFFMSNPLLIPL